MTTRKLFEITSSGDVGSQIPGRVFNRVMRRFSSQQEKDDFLGFISMTKKKGLKESSSASVNVLDRKKDLLKTLAIYIKSVKMTVASATAIKKEIMNGTIDSKHKLMKRASELTESLSERRR